jgi:uncharacterized phiE125 gp8 family phage protein
MSLTRLSPPSVTPVALAQVRAQCRVDDNSEDALLMGYIRSAADWVQEQEGIALITSSWAWRLPVFPYRYNPPITLPLRPLQTVTEIAYTDTNGVAQILPTADYTIVSGKLWPAFGLSWPETRWPSDIAITFTAGYGDDWNSVPEPIRHAVMLLVSYWYDMRSAAIGEGGPVTHVPFSVRELLYPYRNWAI